MRAQHTPGPWEFKGALCGEAIVCKDGLFVAIGGGGSFIANAHLIAASPDLLAALEELVIQCQSDQWFVALNDDGLRAYNKTADALQKARAAIARAKGQP